jgi:DNA polymerase V
MSTASQHQSPTLKIRPITTDTELELLLGNAVAAGFPSPAQDYQDGVIDLNRELVPHPRSTFCVIVDGDSMQDAQLQDGDVLIVDKSIEAYDGCIAVCLLDGDFTVKHFHKVDGRVVLQPANRRYPPIAVEPEQDFAVWGVVCYVIHKTHRR